MSNVPKSALDKTKGEPARVATPFAVLLVSTLFGCGGGGGGGLPAGTGNSITLNQNPNPNPNILLVISDDLGLDASSGLFGGY